MHLNIPGWFVHVLGPEGGSACDVPWLALHGFTGSGADWEPVARRLGRRILAPDLPGHGGTPAGGTVEGAAEVLGGLLDRIGPTTVLGYSLGGRTALRLALDDPSRVRRLVLVGATAGLGEPRERAARRRADEALAMRLQEEGLDAFLERWWSLPIIASQGSIDPAVLQPMKARRREQSAEGLASSLRAMGTGVMEPLWGELGGLDCPVWLVVGEHDAKYRRLAAELEAALPDARVLVAPGVGHCAHLEALPWFLGLFDGVD